MPGQGPLWMTYGQLTRGTQVRWTLSFFKPGGWGGLGQPSGKMGHGQEDTASCTAAASAFQQTEGTPKMGNPWEKTKDPFTKGLRSYIQEWPWHGQGRAKAVLSDHGYNPLASS